MTAHSPAPSKSVQLDRYTYEVTGIRRGGMGTVWLLRRPDSAPAGTIYGRTRAVKTFDATEDDEEVLVEHELGNWATLHHESIVPLIKIVRLEFRLGAMMENMPGSLADYLRHHPNLNPLEVTQILADISRGLDYAYQTRYLAHLDLKPENLLLRATNSPRVKISDWGISKMMSGHRNYANWFSEPMAWMARQFEDKTQFCGGTLPYMAPERFSGAWQVGPEADVFSLGIIAIQLLTGQLPTIERGQDLKESVKIICSSEYFARTKALLRPVRDKLTDIILQMVHPDPGRRFHNYPALISILEQN